MTNFYKTKSALQLKLILPTYNAENFIEKTGCILFEAATGNDRKYDWGNKVNFALLDNDMAAVLESFEAFNLSKIDIAANEGAGEAHKAVFHLRLTHDPNAQTANAGKGIIKSLEIKNGNNPKTFFFTIYYNENKTVVNKVTVPLTLGELLKLELLIKAYYPKFLL